MYLQQAFISVVEKASDYRLANQDCAELLDSDRKFV